MILAEPRDPNDPDDEERMYLRKNVRGLAVFHGVSPGQYGVAAYHLTHTVEEAWYEAPVTVGEGPVEIEAHVGFRHVSAAPFVGSGSRQAAVRGELDGWQRTVLLVDLAFPEAHLDGGHALVRAAESTDYLTIRSARGGPYPASVRLYRIPDALAWAGYDPDAVPLDYFDGHAPGATSEVEMKSATNPPSGSAVAAYVRPAVPPDLLLAPNGFAVVVDGYYAEAVFVDAPQRYPLTYAWEPE